MTNLDKQKIGKLTAFGIKEAWQCLLFLPDRYDDFSTELSSFAANILPGSSYYFQCRITIPPKVTFKGKVPRLTAVVEDIEGNRGRIMAYGDTRELEQQFSKIRGWFYLYALLDRDEETGQVWINNPEIVPQEWQGKLRPHYPGKPHVIGSELIRKRIIELIPHEVRHTAQWVEQQMNEYGTQPEIMAICGLPQKVSYENIILRSHLPKTLKQANLAQNSLMKLAAIKLIRDSSKEALAPIEVDPIPMQQVWTRLSTIPFKLTDDQVRAVKEIVADLESDRPSKRLLAGDVATGKTIVYALAAAAVADAGRTTAIMLPTAGLVEQVSANMQTWWPDLQIQRITGETSDGEMIGQIVIGTTALLHRRFHKAPDFLVIDEQHKYSREQREQLMSPHTHLLEVTATPIPRTQALLRYGILSISRLKMRFNKNKIETRIWSTENTKDLSASVHQTLQKGHQLLVIYPKREPDETGKIDLKDIQTAYEGWNKKFPERVRMAHGAMSNSDKVQVLDDMRQRKADILVATTIVEIGIDLADLYHLLIISPERYGLVTLHQLRGRVARQGGEGKCDLLLTREISQKSRSRLDAFVKETDGLKLAEIDMKTRGIGDLSSEGNKQSGADETFLFGRSLDIEILDEMVQIIT